MDGLPADAEFDGDLLPRPAHSPGADNLRSLEMLDKATQSGDGAETLAWVAVARGHRKLCCLIHDVNLH